MLNSLRNMLTPARVFTVLQALSVALAWEDLIEKGLANEAQVLEMFRLAFDTLNAAALGKMYYEVSAARAAVLANSAYCGSMRGQGRLRKALTGAKGMAGVMAFANIGASTFGMLQDLEEKVESFNDFKISKVVENASPGKQEAS